MFLHLICFVINNFRGKGGLRSVPQCAHRVAAQTEKMCIDAKWSLTVPTRISDAAAVFDGAVERSAARCDA